MPEFVCEHVAPDDRLALGNGAAGRMRDRVRQAGEPGEVEAGQKAVQALQGRGHFREAGVAGPLAQAPDRHGRVGRACPDRRECVGGRETVVVVPVELDRQIRHAHDRRDHFVGSKRIERADRVGQPEPESARLGDGFDKALEMVRIGARSILGADRHLEAGIERHRHVTADPIERFRPVKAQLDAEQPVRGGNRQVDRPDPGATRRVDVGLAHPAPGEHAYAEVRAPQSLAASRSPRRPSPAFRPRARARQL